VSVVLSIAALAAVAVLGAALRLVCSGLSVSGDRAEGGASVAALSRNPPSPAISIVTALTDMRLRTILPGELLSPVCMNSIEI
jgi:hypothetical protein